VEHVTERLDVSLVRGSVHRVMSLPVIDVEMKGVHALVVEEDRSNAS
jgi:hypothetical protein